MLRFAIGLGTYCGISGHKLEQRLTREHQRDIAEFDIRDIHEPRSYQISYQEILARAGKHAQEVRTKVKAELYVGVASGFSYVVQENGDLLGPFRFDVAVYLDSTGRPNHTTPFKLNTHELGRQITEKVCRIENDEESLRLLTALLLDFYEKKILQKT